MEKPDGYLIGDDLKDESEIILFDNKLIKSVKFTYKDFKEMKS
jgi:hypothetical protein